MLTCNIRFRASHCETANPPLHMMMFVIGFIVYLGMYIERTDRGLA